uniref:Succinate:cytochrome c oxidoreductase subunit 3 n=1 Tax=Gelidiella flabella TaxID=2026927 RepID=A0A7G9IW78_9FLOR|nr:succinate:cytochrome c oxidoreductase subunit 3 [Gelidiella flabella]QNM39622.1 succinate:cytochrome c oxidoreductase subunit 3 [Gelidiella flabella]
MFRDFSSFNRPLSPHLTIYLPQHSSLFSIWHRFSGILLLFSLFLFLIFINLLSFCGLQNFIYVLDIFLSYKIKKLVFLFCSLLSVYHFSNGIRHIVWDLGIWLHKAYFIYFTMLITFMFLLITAII